MQEMEPFIGSTGVYLWNPHWRRYVRMKENDDQADGVTWRGSWESFEIHDAGDGKIALYNSHHRRFLRMHVYNGHHVKMDSTTYKGSWESFRVIDMGLGKVAFHNPHHNRFIRMICNGQCAMD